ncbi:histidine kinase [Nostoc linckia]|uniref:histidine kinase n=1 Tax=Nostoc linckia TaxID=92942 RepID=UPI00211EF865|nr:histidine kinase [Nostoc linckia]
MGEMGGWGDGENNNSPVISQHPQCPMPPAQCPMPNNYKKFPIFNSKILDK